MLAVTRPGLQHDNQKQDFCSEWCFSIAMFDKQMVSEFSEMWVCNDMYLAIYEELLDFKAVSSQGFVLSPIWRTFLKGL